ncbi:hypothetical protein MANES_04G059588v8 [Manihot esculenta]|uniref:Uncharacterized protein n=1 Tax=Manihot esculenta TaxID=3983 RepID=A0ACB7HU96_MANES|nr:hypothetical protein MANES_04G059588v8 [Manihot esculenta]
MYSTVTRSITNDIKMRYTALWKTWSEIPLKTKDELFGLFRSRYVWDESKKRLRDIVNRVRSELLRKHKKTDSTPEWRKKSEAGKANRNVEKDGTITKHSGGSIKLEVHENRLAKKLGRQPTQLELFRATHTKKGVKGAYLSAIAENVNSNCKSQYAFDLNKWIEISGSSKWRVYGFGSSDIAKSETPTTSFSCTSAHSGGPSQTMFSLEEVEQIFRAKPDQNERRHGANAKANASADRKANKRSDEIIEKQKKRSSPHNTIANSTSLSDGSTN